MTNPIRLKQYKITVPSEYDLTDPDNPIEISESQEYFGIFFQPEIYYNKTDVDNLLNNITSGIIWKESVSSVSDLTTTYPNALQGWTALVRDIDKIYTFNGSNWLDTGLSRVPLADATTNGLLLSTDFIKLQGIAQNANNYIHPTTHPATIIVQDSTHKFVTEDQIQRWEDLVNNGNFPGYGGNGTQNTVSRSDHDHATIYEPIINTKLTAFNKNFGGNGVLESISRSDHDHNDIYYNKKIVSLGLNESLDTLIDGVYFQENSNNATIANKYPIQESGSLWSMRSTQQLSSNQIYGSYSQNKWFARGGGESQNQRTIWKEFVFQNDDVVFDLTKTNSLITGSNKHWISETSQFGVDLKNSDIIGVNSIFFEENNSLNFKRTDQNGVTIGEHLNKFDNLKILNGSPTINEKKIWYEDNDGIDSGLDADLLDGKQGKEYSTIYKLSNQTNNEIGWYKLGRLTTTQNSFITEFDISTTNGFTANENNTNIRIKFILKTSISGSSNNGVYAIAEGYKYDNHECEIIVVQVSSNNIFDIYFKKINIYSGAGGFFVVTGNFISFEYSNEYYLLPPTEINQIKANIFQILTNTNSNFVKKSGDVMTGNLNLPALNQEQLSFYGQNLNLDSEKGSQFNTFSGYDIFKLGGDSQFEYSNNNIGISFGITSINRIENLNAPNTSGKILEVTTFALDEFTSGSKGAVYANRQISNKNNAQVYVRIVAKIKIGENPNFRLPTNGLGIGGYQKILTPMTATGKWEEYGCLVSLGSGFSESDNIILIPFALDGGDPNPLTFQIAFWEVFDLSKPIVNTKNLITNNFNSNNIIDLNLINPLSNECLCFISNSIQNSTITLNTSNLNDLNKCFKFQIKIYTTNQSINLIINSDNPNYLRFEKNLNLNLNTPYTTYLFEISVTAGQYAIGGTIVRQILIKNEGEFNN